MFVETRDAKIRRDVDKLRQGGELEVLLEEEGLGLYRRLKKAPAP